MTMCVVVCPVCVMVNCGCDCVGDPITLCGWSHDTGWSYDSVGGHASSLYDGQLRM